MKKTRFSMASGEGGDDAGRPEADMDGEPTPELSTLSAELYKNDAMAGVLGLNGQSGLDCKIA